MERLIEIRPGFSIPIEVHEENGEHIISIDGTEWVRTKNYMHATVLFNMLANHVAEYVNYVKK